MTIAAGEYGSDLFYFKRMLEAGAVDVLQADVTRCAGISELLPVGALCQAHAIPLSAHTAPSIHAHAWAAIGPLVHLESLHDHARIDRILFDGVLAPRRRRTATRPRSSWTGIGTQKRRREGVLGRGVILLRSRSP